QLCNDCRPNFVVLGDVLRMQHIKRRWKVFVGQMLKLDRDQLAISLSPTSLRTDPVRFDRCVGPYDDDCTGTAQLGHYLVTEIVANGETCVPPDLPAFGLQHCRKLRC